MIIEERNIEFKSSTTIIDGEHFEIDGLNIWDYEWRNTGDKLVAFDAYQKKRLLNIVEITDGSKVSKFAAEEVSNCVWMICYD